MLKTKIQNGIPEITPQDAKSILKDVLLIDVRQPDEFTGELSHIEGAQLVTLGPALSKFLETGDRQKDVLFICKSGGRSGKATQEALALGYKSVANITGGMILWNELNLPIKKK
jgi:rhodanese-related sulfurtransferase